MVAVPMEVWAQLVACHGLDVYAVWARRMALPVLAGRALAMDKSLDMVCRAGPMRDGHGP